jgi:predicted DNA-binding transcriptional regulator YafY
VGDFTELENWILGWGAQARVLAPASLAAKIRETARALVAAYEAPDQG